MSRGKIVLTGLTALLLCVPLPAGAGFYSWSNPDGGDWGSGSNWQASSYPKYFWDFATFALDGTYEVDATGVSSVSVALIEITQGDVVLRSNQLTGVLSLTGGSLLLAEGVLQSSDAHLVGAGGVLTVAGGATLVGGVSRNYAVDLSGALYGNGTVDGNVVRNNGMISAGSGPAQTGLLILGDTAGGLDQRSAGTLVADLSSGGSDQVVALQASLAGALQVNLLDGYVPQTGDRFTVLSSAAPITGTFESVAWPDGADFELEYGEFGVDVVVTGVWAQAPEVSMDVKPGSCRNPINVKSRGVLPVALMFPPDTDLEGLDPASMLLAGVPALRIGLDDVSSPSDSTCGCDRDPDGVPDVVLKFDNQAVVEALGDVEDGQEIMLELTGVLPDGTVFSAVDCVEMLVKGKSKGRFAAGVDADAPALWQDADAGLVYFRVPVAGEVRVTVHDVQGRRIQALTQTVSAAGEYALPQNNQLAGGVYFYRLESAAGIVTAKVLQLRR